MTHMHRKCTYWSTMGCVFFTFPRLSRSLSHGPHTISVFTADNDWVSDVAGHTIDIWPPEKYVVYIICMSQV